ncbi:hypothetical protein NG891_14910 [Enterococcus gallinarum]|uniref:hypothetical protein n=1 Tax=Enterococcus gallinarum TaxID=1353 RepID=UPI0020915B12|nr:hypothetical protein [Enterococcus gallinarum]MCO5478037.1 hypothetical protein [Enterococcus gallinarum]
MKFDTTKVEPANKHKKLKKKSRATFQFQIPKKKNQTSQQVLQQELSQDELKDIGKRKKMLRKMTEIHPIRGWGSEPTENFIRYTRGYFEVVKMRGHNLFGMKEEQFFKIMESYAALSSLYEPPFKLISIHSPVDTSMQQGYFRRTFQRASENFQKDILQTKYEELASIAKYRQMEDYFIFIFGYDEKTIRENLEDFYKCAGVLQLEKLNREEKVQLLFRMNNPTKKLAPAPIKNLEITDKRVLDSGIDPELLYRIQPLGNSKFTETAMRTDQCWQACLHAFKLQPEPDYLWMSPLTKIKDKILMVDVATQSDDSLRQDIQKTLVHLKGTYQKTNDDTEKEMIQEEYTRLISLSKDIRKKREIMKYVSIRLYLYADTQKELEKRVKETQKKLEKEEFGFACFTLEQEYEWQSLFLDYFSQTMLPNRRSGLDIATNEFGASYPANQVYLSDARGQYIGVSNTGGHIFLDVWEYLMDQNRTFYNILITGLMGNGKTTLMKKIMDDNIGRGYLVRGFDKSGEFTRLIRKRKGEIIRLDGQDGRINILEVIALAVNDETLEVSEQSSFMMHLSKLGTWYSILKPSAPIEELDMFDSIIIELYRKAGLSDKDGHVTKITGLPSERYPILSDVISVIDDRYKNSKYEQERNHLYNIQSTLTTLLQKTNTLFDGPTTIPDISDQQVLFFNIDGLSNFEQRFVNAQLFNAFNLFSATLFNNGRREHRRYQRGEISFEEIRRGMFFMAESHNLINQNNPRMVSFFNTYAREARKRYAGLCLDTQSVRSLVSTTKDSTSTNDDEAKDIYDFMNYRFFFQPGDGESENLSEENGGVLTAEQATRLNKFIPGQALLRIGKSDAYELFVYASEEELDLYDGGGRKGGDI